MQIKVLNIKKLRSYGAGVKTKSQEERIAGTSIKVNKSQK
jgi:hypothetical protein